MTNSRAARLLDDVAARIPVPYGRCCLVGVDGPDGSGKSVFADALASAVRRQGRPVVRVSLDDFHRPRAIRYRRGRESPNGFWLDSYDYDRFVADVVRPLRTLREPRVRLRAHDLASDEILDPDWTEVAVESVVLVDGIFLHRDELAWAWDLSVFLDVPFEVTAARMALREGTQPDPSHPSMRRYVDGQRLYFAACRPASRAGLVIDNSDYDAPELIRIDPACGLVREDSS